MLQHYESDAAASEKALSLVDGSRDAADFMWSASQQSMPSDLRLALLGSASMLTRLKSQSEGTLRSELQKAMRAEATAKLLSIL